MQPRRASAIAVPIFDAGEQPEDAEGAADAEGASGWADPGGAAIPASGCAPPLSPHAGAVRDFEDVFDHFRDGAAAPAAAAPSAGDAGQGAEPMAALCREQQKQQQQRQRHRLPPPPPPSHGGRGVPRHLPAPAELPAAPGPRPATARWWPSLAHLLPRLPQLLPPLLLASALCCCCWALVGAAPRAGAGPGPAAAPRGHSQLALAAAALSGAAHPEARLGAPLPAIVVGGGVLCMLLGASVASCIWLILQQGRRGYGPVNGAPHKYLEPPLDDTTGRELFTLDEFVQKLQSKLGITVTEEQLHNVCASLRRNGRGAISATTLLQACFELYGHEMRTKTT